MLKLHETEWGPASHRVRERLTELGIHYLVRQVPVRRSARTALAAAAGTDTIPALLLEDDTAVVAEDAIDAYLDSRLAEPPEAEAHRVKAEEAHRRYTEEECTC